MKTTICFMIDSLRPKDITSSNTPFLSSLQSNSIVAEIIPPFAFEPDVAYIAGLYPEQSDEGTMFWLSPPPIKIRKISNIFSFLDKTPDHFNIFFRYALRAYFRFGSSSPAEKYFRTTANIPISLIKYFDIIHKKLMYENNFCNGKTVFELIEEEKGNWLYLGYPLTSSSVIDIYNRFKRIKIAEFDFIFAMINKLDIIGHKYGPDSVERKYIMKEIDAYLQKVFYLVKKQIDNFNFIIFSDHGMVSVKSIVNIWEEIHKLPLKIEKDYLVFLDSTLARFWFFSEKAKSMIKNVLENINGGRIISEKEMKIYRIRYKHNKFGDLLYWVDNGNIILPNFFQGNKIPMGMHGYRNDCLDNHSFYMSFSSFKNVNKKMSQAIPMVRIFPSILNNLGIDYTKYTQERPID